MKNLVELDKGTILEFRPGATGFGVDLHSNAKTFQVFWSENEQVARAYFDGYVFGSKKVNPDQQGE